MPGLRSQSFSAVLGKVVGVMSLLTMVAALWVVGSYETVPNHTTDLTHFDTIIVLGTPATGDGKPTPEMEERVMEGVREFRAGRAGYLIMTGGPAHNNWTEGGVMAQLAEKAGVPAEKVVVEGQARNTIENIYYSRKIMNENGWTSAEIVSSPSHLPRTGLILQRYGFLWRTHASHWPPSFSVFHIAGIFWYEAVGTAKLRWFGFRPNGHLPEMGKG
jgi:uncharacterized SAM-binding protein YcdF (DUF218 family)